MLFSIGLDDFRRLERFLPTGLVPDADAGSLERAAGELARLVLTQQLSPGQKVPIDTIAERIGASRTPVREALRLLETDGLVAAVLNRGFVMRRLGPVETSHLYEARRCIEAFTARAAFSRRDKAFLQELAHLHRMYCSVLGGPSDRRRLGMLVDKAFHVRIAEQAGNPHLTTVVSNVFDRLILTRPIEGFPVNRMKQALAEHASVLKAFQSGTARQAAEALLRNVDNGGAAIVEHMLQLQEFGVSP